MIMPIKSFRINLVIALMVNNFITMQTLSLNMKYSFCHVNC